MTRMFWRFALPALVGAVVGLTTDDPISDAAKKAVNELHDKAYPVIESTLEVTDKQADHWTAVMQSVKHRDCRLLEVQAFDVSPTNEIHRLSFARADGKEASGMQPGAFRSATYRISPPPVHRLAVSFVHECDGRSVRTVVKVKP